MTYRHYGLWRLWLSMVWVELTTDSIQWQNVLQMLEFPCLAGCNNQRTMHRHVHRRDSSGVVSHHCMTRCRLLRLRKYSPNMAQLLEVFGGAWREALLDKMEIIQHLFAILTPQVPPGNKMAFIFGRPRAC